MNIEYTNIYNNLINLSRNKTLFIYFTEKDTFSDRLLIFLFHLAFFLKNFKSQKDKKYLQKFYDYTFRQIELDIREIGYGDQSVNKKMKTYVNLLYSIIDKIDKWETYNLDKKMSIINLYIEIKYYYMKSIYDFQIKSKKEYKIFEDKAKKDPEKFWSEIAKTFKWNSIWEKVLESDWTVPSTKWFINGKLNITENCLDIHAKSNPDKVAILWEPNNPNGHSQRITYKELLSKVCRFSNGLKELGVKKGDRICLYMPMIPELTVAVLACARIGAIHSVVFAGFSSKALSARINDSKCSILITADGAFRGNKTLDLKSICDDALKSCPSVKKSIVYKRCFVISTT